MKFDWAPVLLVVVLVVIITLSAVATYVLLHFIQKFW